jgi:formate dehydrogenase subunit gamma
VVSFYEDFKTSLPAKTLVRICRGEACQSLGANALIDQAKNLKENIDVEAVYCLGNCALAPAIMIDNKLHGRVNEKRLGALTGESGR